MDALRIGVRSHPEMKLIVSGKTSQRVVDMVRSYGVQDNVVFIGFVSTEDLAWHMGAANVFVLPYPDTIYNRGRWPNKLGLYMCLGRPTVSNPTGDVKALFEHRRVGVLANWDPEEFAAEILGLVENPELARELGANARQVAVTEHDWDNLVSRLEDFYVRLLAQ
jgi:glycosyltransferase involved in cell wall biosynthesis